MKEDQSQITCEKYMWNKLALIDQPVFVKFYFTLWITSRMFHKNGHFHKAFHIFQFFSGVFHFYTPQPLNTVSNEK